MGHFGERPLLRMARGGWATGVSALLLVTCGQRPTADDPASGNWTRYGLDDAETRNSPLTSINRNTVGGLGLVWSHDLDTDRGQEATPLVINGVIYNTTAWSKLIALDGGSGRVLWRYDPKVPGSAAANSCCDVVNRGAAYWKGRLYWGTLDGRLIAVDAKTGKRIWQVATVAPGAKNTITGAPRVVKGKVIIGNGGAEMGARGYVSAYDAMTGGLVWRFYTVPGKPGVRDGAASDAVLARLAAPTWKGDYWNSKGGFGGGTVWDAMAYDAKRDLLYIGTGNGSYWSRKIRSNGTGDNLFLSSIIALRPDTGRYVWHYQQVPGDEWDYTATQSIILADLKVMGRVRPVLMLAPKNGFFYMLDRESGKLLSATPYADVNWADGIDPASGRPRIRAEARYSETGKPFLGKPGPSGAHNWHPMAWSARTGLAYIPVQHTAGLYTSDPGFRANALGVNVPLRPATLALPDDPAARRVIRAGVTGELLAWDPARGRAAWRVQKSCLPNGGVLSTDGGLVFEGDCEGYLNAYDAATGRRLWRFDAQSAIMAPPVTWQADGRQYVTVVAGWGGSLALMLGDAVKDAAGRARLNRSRVLTFALGGRAVLPRRAEVIASPLPLPTEAADAATISLGKTLYHRTCFACHGLSASSGGPVPDLRLSPVSRDASAWQAVVSQGVLVQRGMIGFSTVYSRAEVEAIRAYVLHQAWVDAAHQ